MPKKRPRNDTAKQVPQVRIARPRGRPIQLRYFCKKENRELRISTNTYDEKEVEEQRRDLEATLRLGLSTQIGKPKDFGPAMEWSDFREQYRTLHLTTLRDQSAIHAESRLDISERIIKPKCLHDMADPITLQQLQSKLLAGVASRREKPRATQTVRGYMSCVLAAINWAYLQGWLPVPPRLRKLKSSKSKVMKGRPITEIEFKKMLEATEGVVGVEAAESWKHILRGLWESALRLDELMHVSWIKAKAIRPVWKDGEFPILEIPASLQKNDTEECIPLLPWFESLLLETPFERRLGWVFNPVSLQLKFGRKATANRSKSDWVGKVIAKIGKAANIIVDEADERTGRPVKYASAHDLRRSCGQRLRDAGVPPLLICRIMRHSSWDTTRMHYAPGNNQKDAEALRKILVPHSVSKTKDEGPPSSLIESTS